MRALGIDTATWTASAGIVADGTILSERSHLVSGSHASALLPLLEETLSAARLKLIDLDLLAISLGPGSFTGLRIGLSVVKGLSLASGLPVIGVPTLEALAVAAGPRDGLVCPVLDARKGEVYAAVFRWNGLVPKGVVAPMAVAPDRLAERVSGICTLIGAGVETYAPLWRLHFGQRATLIEGKSVAPSGAVIAALGARRFAASGADDLDRLEPSYVRRSEAEIHRDARANIGASSGCGKIDRVEVVS